MCSWTSCCWISHRRPPPQLSGQSEVIRSTAARFEFCYKTPVGGVTPSSLLSYAPTMNNYPSFSTESSYYPDNQNRHPQWIPQMPSFSPHYNLRVDTSALGHSPAPSPPSLSMYDAWSASTQASHSSEHTCVEPYSASMAKFDPSFVINVHGSDQSGSSPLLEPLQMTEGQQLGLALPVISGSHSPVSPLTPSESNSGQDSGSQVSPLSLTVRYGT